jgi:hypothetical protein
MMPPRGVKSPKRQRQYEKIKKSARSQGKSPRRAKELAARTVNKQRREAGETKAPRSGGKARKAAPVARTGRKSATRKTGTSRSRTSSGARKTGTSRSRASSGARKTGSRRSSRTSR